MTGLGKSINIILLVALLASCSQDERIKKSSLSNQVTITDSLMVYAILEFQKEILYKDKKDNSREGVVVVQYLHNDTCKAFTITSTITDYDMKNRLPSCFTLINDRIVFMYTGYEGILAEPNHYFDSLKGYYKNKLQEVTQPEELAEIKFDTSDFVPIIVGATYDPSTWYINYCDSTIIKNFYK